MYFYSLLKNENDLIAFLFKSVIFMNLYSRGSYRVTKIQTKNLMG